MRRFVLPVVLSIASLAIPASIAQAQPAARPTVSEVRVTIGPKLEAQADKLGQGDLDMLAKDLKADMERELRRVGRLGPGGARLDLQIVEAEPDHPTMAQLARNPSLDYHRSVSKGGAAIEGVEILPDGTRRPVHYREFQDMLYWARGQSTWGDAQSAFDTFARSYANGRR